MLNYFRMTLNQNIAGIIASIVAMTTSSSIYAKDAQQDIARHDEILKKKAAFLDQKFPIGFYTDRYNLVDESTREIFKGDKEVADWAEMGCTVMMSPRFTSKDPMQVEAAGEILRACEAHGMKMLLADRRFYQQRVGKMTEEKYRKEVETAGDFFTRFPAFAGFKISDEPNKDIIDDVAQAMRIQKEVLPNSMPFLNLGFEPSDMGKETWEAFFDSVIEKCHPNVLSYDYYGQILDDSKIPYYFNVLKKMQEASLRNGLPFWFVPLAVGHMHFRCPSYDDIRWQFNTAICSGASGIQWFFYYLGDSTCANYRLAPVDMNGDKTPAWFDFKRVHLDFLNHYGDLFTRLVSNRVSHYPKIAGGDTWKPNALLSSIETDTPDHPLVVGEFKDAEQRDYLMVVNSSMDSSVAVTLTFPKDSRIFHYLKAKEVEGAALEAAGPIVSLPDGFSIKHWLAPGQETVYRVATSKK